MKQRRNIQVVESMFESSEMRMRFVLDKCSAKQLLRKIRSIDMHVLRQHPKDPTILLWVPITEGYRQLEFQFETALAAAMFESLYKEQLRRDNA